MFLDDDARKFNEIFIPGLLDEMLAVMSEDRKFAYYTMAETATKIIQNGEIWLRNATIMNDFSEISYGLNLIEATFSGPLGKSFREAIDGIFEGTIAETEKLLAGWMPDWELETYIACISAHKLREDKSGRLSMWRAYGNTALVVKNTPLVAVTDLLGVYSLPVAYLSREQYEARLEKITKAVLDNARYLERLGSESLVGSIYQMLFHTAIGTKHPGFEEEQEWRLYYRPNEQQSKVVRPMTVVIDGVPQLVYVLPLRNDPSNGLYGADIPSLLDRVIIGPTEFPYVSAQAFRTILRAAGVENVESKVISSDIPLRAR
jgi:hypothetical protein